jgi:hypothetical protein
MDPQKKEFDTLVWSLAKAMAMKGDQDTTPGKEQISIIVDLDPITAMQLLVTTNRYHDTRNLELSMVLFEILDRLKGRYPEIEHLMKDTSLTDQEKIEKSKTIFGIES